MNAAAWSLPAGSPTFAHREARFLFQNDKEPIKKRDSWLNFLHIAERADPLEAKHFCLQRVTGLFCLSKPFTNKTRRSNQNQPDFAE